jgi:hypothetical protein
MNQNQHRQFAVDALRTAVALSASNNPPDGRDLSILSSFGKAFQREVIEAAAAPDRIRDTYLTLPSLPDVINPFPDVYNIRGHNMTSFQHFMCNRNGKPAGYLWKQDASLTAVGGWASSELLELMRTEVRWRQDTKGEMPPEMHKLFTPMELRADEQKGVTLDAFEFPSADVVGGFYADHAYAAWVVEDFKTWRKCAGFALHFVQDALVPHHTWGVLEYGHNAWENAIEVFWREHLRLIHSTDPTGKLYQDTVCKAVAEELAAIVKCGHTKVADLIYANAYSTTAWLKFRGMAAPTDLDECPALDGLRICIRAVAASVRALMLMIPNTKGEA